jgi:nucleoside-diphosphate-sugar epimerase
MTQAVILGATGPTGIHLAEALRQNGTAVRVVARGLAKLSRMYPDVSVDKRQADLLDPDQTSRAIHGCDLVYDCIGLPGDQMHLHAVTARNIARSLNRRKARCVQVSSYWAYYPQVREVMNEGHPRNGGPAWARHRREAEDILIDAGAAILHLPDFYGPHVHVSTFQNALVIAATGKTINWIGPADSEREYIFVPDAMRIACAIGHCKDAARAHWCLPGSGPITGQQVADIASRRLGHKVRLRSAGSLMLRMVSLFNKDLRGFMQVAPNYMKPVRYDARKLEGLLSRQAMTPYDLGIANTLQWIAGTTQR